MLKMISFLYQAELTSSFTQALTSALSIIQKKPLSALIFLSCTSLLKFYGISFKDHFLFASRWTRCCFVPESECKITRFMRTDQIFQEEIFEKFRRLSRKLRYAPYSHGFKAHKKFLPESAFLVPTKGELVQTRRDANANLCLSYRPDKFFNRIFTRLCP